MEKGWQKVNVSAEPHLTSAWQGVMVNLLPTESRDPSLARQADLGATPMPHRGKAGRAAQDDVDGRFPRHLPE